MHALEQADRQSRWARLTISQKKKHLMLQVENPVAKMPEFVDGIPVSAKEGHGIGVKSIIYYVEQLNGQCQFSVSDQLFILKIFI